MTFKSLDCHNTNRLKVSDAEEYKSHSLQLIQFCEASSSIAPIIKQLQRP